MATNSHVISLRSDPSTPQGNSGVGEVNTDLLTKVEMALSPKSYVKETEEGIYVDLSFIDNLESPDQENPRLYEKNLLKTLHDTIYRYIDTQFGSRKKLVGVQYDLLDILMNGTSEEVLKLKKQNENTILLAKSIESFDIKILKVLYRGVFSYPNTTETYTGRFLSGQELKNLMLTWNEGDLGNVGKMLGENGAGYLTSFDDFFIFLWEQGIHFGIRYKEIGNFFESHKERRSFPKGNIPIAFPKLPKNGTDDMIEYNVKMQPERGASENEKRSDVRVSSYTFPQVQKGKLIATVISGQEGEDGIDIHGKPIPHTPGLNRIVIFSENIPRSIPTGVKYKYLIDEGREFIKVNTGGGKQFISAIDSVFISKAKGGQLILGKKIVHKSRIGGGDGGTETSIIVMNKDTLFQQVGNIQFGYSLQGWDLSIARANDELSGLVIAEKDIHIDTSNVFRAQIVSRQGNISIDKASRVHSDTHISAINGKVQIWGSIENVVICADEIEIYGKAVNCTLLGKKVLIHESQRNTIAGENISVNFEKGESNYIALVFYTVLKYLKGLNQKIEDMQKKISDLTQLQKQDPSLITKIQELTGFIEKDRFVQSKMKEIHDSYIGRFGGYITIFNCNDLNSLGRVMALPINFILDNVFYREVNQKTSEEERSQKKDAELSALLRNIREHMSEISSQGVSLPLSSSGKSLRVLHDDALIALMDKKMANPVKKSENMINGRMDSARDILLSREDAGNLINGIPLGSKKTLVIPATLEGNDGCYLGDISARGASFIIPKEMTHIEKDRCIAVSYSLPSIDQGNMLLSTSSFRVMRVEEYGNYIKVSGEYMGEEVDKKIQLFRNYLMVQKKQVAN